MRRTALLLALALIAAACGVGGGGEPISTITTSAGSTTTTAELASTTTIDTGFPVTVEDMNGPVTIESKPVAIVSLSATATEMLFAIGAGPQVVAVDEFSDYPAEAPTTSLSGFNFNLEAVLTYGPDLVVAAWDPGGLVDGLTEVEVPVLLLPAALTLDDVYAQTETLGVASDHTTEADRVVAQMQAEIQLVIDGSSVPEGLTVYHEADPTFWSASSFSFIGQLYSLLGMTNVADAADANSTGFPQLSSEYLVAEDPDFIFLADASLGVTPESLAERPGWSEMSAVESGAVEVLDEDIASRWGPRVIDLLRSIHDAVAEYALSS
jgi:iron complex transport system substrate-binding protein